MNDPPPPRIITGAACLRARNVPTTFRSMVSRKAWVSTWVTGPMVDEPPAEATTTSRVPVGSVAAATAA